MCSHLFLESFEAFAGAPRLLEWPVFSALGTNAGGARAISPVAILIRLVVLVRSQIGERELLPSSMYTYSALTSPRCSWGSVPPHPQVQAHRLRTHLLLKHSFIGSPSIFISLFVRIRKLQLYCWAVNNNIIYILKFEICPRDNW